MPSRKTLRILTVMNAAAGHPSGMPTANRALSEAMLRQGCQVDHLYLGDVPGWVARPPFNYSLFAIAAAAAIRRRESGGGRYDVLQFSGGDGYLAPLFPGRLRVARSHGLEHRYWTAYLAQVAAGNEALRRRHHVNFSLRMKQVEATIRTCDLLNCHTAADRDFALERAWKRPDEICVIPSGVEAGLLEIPIQPRSSGDRLLWSGSWTWMKGHRLLPAVLARLPAAISLTIAGTGRSPEAVLADFPEPLRQRVRVLPALPHEAMADVFRTHDALLATSYFEGWGTIVSEAMAAGLPVAAARVGGATDRIDAGRSGWLAAPGDADGLAAAAEQALGAGTAARELARDAVRDIVWPAVAAQTIACYGSHRA
ncbi:MAG: hypothetical protein NVS9B1_21130 [Candidatus Dormibacteraceae bacterium]